MMTLYVKTGCPFCARTLAALDAHGIAYETKNVADPGVVEELIALGGKKQEPFLVDGHTMMYDSQSIINYIERKYGNHASKGQKPRIHFARGTELCSS